MKTKTDFITNSSSTNFIFMFKGDDLEDLFKKIKRHRDDFRIMYRSGEKKIKCNHNDVIKSIEKAYRTYSDEKDYYRLKVKNIEVFEKEKNDLFNDLRNNEYEFESFYDEPLSRIISFCKTAKEKGINSVLEIEFGDNHGHVSGGRVGSAMDYEGRRIFIKEDDFIVMTEQHR